MKKLLLIGLSFLLLIVGCGNPTDSSDTDNIIGTWRSTEIKRTNKELGASLEANVSVYLDKSYFECIQNIDLPELFITSNAKAYKLDDPNKKNPFKLEEINGIEIFVKKAKGTKCSLCWKIKEKKCYRINCSIV